MNVLIAGSRSAERLGGAEQQRLAKAVNVAVAMYRNDLILVGDAGGVDAMVVSACVQRRVEYLCVGVFPHPRNGAAHYQQLNESPEQAAKPLYARFLHRDAYLFQLADHVLCFWDGQSHGTKAMIDRTRKSSKSLVIHRFFSEV